MAEPEEREAASGGHSGSAWHCPPWCVTQHGEYQGEEDWLHSGEPVLVADGLQAQLWMSVDPGTGREDGPFVLIGSTELSLAAAAALGAALVQMTE